jgi:hypothetical protein
MCRRNEVLGALHDVKMSLGACDAKR